MAAGLALGQPFSRAVPGGGAAPPPFDPTQIVGLQAWYDSSDASTHTFSSGNNVSQWRDKSGNSRQLAQGTVANQPVRSGVRNSLATNTFSRGANNRRIIYAGSSGINVGTCTIFVVFLETTDAGSFGGVLSISGAGSQQDSDNNKSCLLQTADASILTGFYSNNQGSSIAGTGLAPFSIYRSVNDVVGGVCVVAKDSVVVQSTALTGTFALADGGIMLGDRLYLGAPANSAINGEIAEVCVYNSVLTAFNVARIELYLRTKWATPPPPPPPTLTSLAPNNCIVNVATAITVTGTNFLPSSVVYADTIALTTTYVSATSLTTSFTPSATGTSQFTVRNGVDISNQVPFTTNATPPFVPTDIPNLKGWWDSNDATSFVYSSGTEVSQWSDKSGGGWHMTQAVVGQQPSRSGTQNGKPTIVYDSSVGDFLATAIGSIVATNPYTLYLALWPYLHGSYETALMDSNDLSRPSLAGDTGNTRFDSFGGSFIWPVNILDDSPLVYSFVVAPNPNGQAFRNGVLISTANHSSWGLQFGLKTGKTAAQEIWRSFFYQYYEILAYQGAHTTVQRQQVEAYLKAKWGTP